MIHLARVASGIHSRMSRMIHHYYVLHRHIGVVLHLHNRRLTRTSHSARRKRLADEVHHQQQRNNSFVFGYLHYSNCVAIVN